MQDPHEDIFDIIDKSLIYTTENIPTKNLEKQDNEFYGCSCKDACTNAACRCYNTSGATFENRVIKKINDNPVYECNDNCSCSKMCTMRCTQFGPMKELKIKSINEKIGYGLFLETDIPQDYFICEYAGELLDETEANTRYTQYKKKGKMNYIFWVKEHFGEKINQTIIDPTLIGNIGRFINHSCDSNCYYILVRVNSVFPKLCIFSKRALKRGEEVTMDYGIQEDDQSRNLEDCKKVQCFCTSENCKGFLPSHNV